MLRCAAAASHPTPPPPLLQPRACPHPAPDNPTFVCAVLYCFCMTSRPVLTALSIWSLRISYTLGRVNRPSTTARKKNEQKQQQQQDCQTQHAIHSHAIHIVFGQRKKNQAILRKSEGGRQQQQRQEDCQLVLAHLKHLGQSEQTKHHCEQGEGECTQPAWGGGCQQQQQQQQQQQECWNKSCISHTVGRPSTTVNTTHAYHGGALAQRGGGDLGGTRHITGSKITMLPSGSGTATENPLIYKHKKKPPPPPPPP